MLELFFFFLFSFLFVLIRGFLWLFAVLVVPVVCSLMKEDNFSFCPHWKDASVYIGVAVRRLSCIYKCALKQYY